MFIEFIILMHNMKVLIYYLVFCTGFFFFFSKSTVYFVYGVVILFSLFPYFYIFIYNAH